MAALCSVAAIIATSHLPVYTSRQALLPQNTPVAQRLNQYLETFGASSDLMVALEEAPVPILQSFAKDLADRLQGQPEIASATAQIDTSFLRQHLYLLAPAGALTSLEPLLKFAARPQGLSLETLLGQALTESSKTPDGPADLALITQLLGSAEAFCEEWERWILHNGSPSDGLNLVPTLKPLGAEQLAGGFYTSHNGKMLLVFVRAREKGEDFAALKPLNERIQSTTEALRKEYQARGLMAPKATLTGLPAIEYEEYLDIEEDIRLVIWSAGTLIALLIFVVVRSLRWALAIFIPMGLGALWSLGFAYLAVGHLTIITSSFLAILFGLGADYGIFTSSQIAEVRQRGIPLEEAILGGIRDSFAAVATAGGASLLIFGTLSTVDFPGFAELGVIAAGGVLLVLISTWWVQPALYALYPPRLRERPQRQLAGAMIQKQIPKGLGLILVVLALALAGLGILKGNRMAFDYDVLSLLPRDSQAAAYQRRLVAETDYQSEIIIFTAPSLNEIRRITEEAGLKKSLAKVLSITSFFPVDEADRRNQATALAGWADPPQISNNLKQLDSDGLSPGAFRAVTELLAHGKTAIEEAEEMAFTAGKTQLVSQLETLAGRLDRLTNLISRDPGQALQGTEALLRALIHLAENGVDLIRTWKTLPTPLQPENLPADLRQRFMAPNGTFAAYAYPAESVYDPVQLDTLMAEVYDVSPDATGFPSTHQVFSKAVVQSFESGTRLAILVCLGWLVVILRKPRPILMAALPLVIGGGWMLGVMSLLGLRYNYANIIALPLVIALAVDYGVWLSHRWSILGGERPLRLALDAGRVILLAAGTELAGLGAITLARYRGVSGLGLDITIGLVTCLIATLLITPVIGQLLAFPAKRQ